MAPGTTKKGGTVAQLTTVYFLTDDGQTAKAIVELNLISFFEQMGARRTPGELKRKNDLPESAQSEDSIESTDAADIDDQDEADSDLNPVHGSGRPGSMRFHTLCILEMQTIDDISDYLEAVTGQRLDARIKKIDKGQKIATKIIKDWLRENDGKNT